MLVQNALLSTIADGLKLENGIGQKDCGKGSLGKRATCDYGRRHYNLESISLKVWE